VLQIVLLLTLAIILHILAQQHAQISNMVPLPQDYVKTAQLHVPYALILHTVQLVKQMLHWLSIICATVIAVLLNNITTILNATQYVPVKHLSHTQVLYACHVLSFVLHVMEQHLIVLAVVIVIIITIVV
jgi:hypothetical protein